MSRISIEAARKRLEFAWSDIDKPIRDLVLVLNVEGFETIMSCAGHRKAETPAPAFVAFAPMPDSDAYRLTRALESVARRIGAAIKVNGPNVAIGVWIADPDGGPPNPKILRRVATMLPSSLEKHAAENPPDVT